MIEICRFKGGRRYVHATDELLTAEPLIANAKSFAFTARKVGQYAAKWYPAEEPESSPDFEPIARLVVDKLDGSRSTYECRQDLRRPIEDQAPYDEERLASFATINAASLTCPYCSEFTVWEHLSTLHKVLLQQHLEHMNWYFVRLEIIGPSSWPRKAIPQSISMRFSHQKGPLFVSKIEFDGKPVGEIAFAKR